MGLLDKKEQIIDFALTSYGRELYAKGILEFHHFVPVDVGVEYFSSSFDGTIEELPVLESLSDDIDIYKFPLFSNGTQELYPKLTFNSGSMIVKRVCDNTVTEDPIMVLLLEAIRAGESSTTTMVGTRVDSLQTRGKITDEKASLQVTRDFTSTPENYILTVEISSSNGNHQMLFVSGSSFGTSENNVELFNKSSEKNYADSFYELLRIVEK